MVSEFMASLDLRLRIDPPAARWDRDPGG